MIYFPSYPISVCVCVYILFRESGSYDAFFLFFERIPKIFKHEA